jgi:hypothetical protein
LPHLVYNQLDIKKRFMAIERLNPDSLGLAIYLLNANRVVLEFAIVK